MKTCPACGNEFSKSTKYCCRTCYFSVPVSDETKHRMSVASKGKPKSEEHRENIRVGTTGKPKPWNQGEKNANFGNKTQGTPEVRERFLKAVRVRGQSWSEEHRKKHSERMLGPSNAMRGTKHTPESIRAISEAKQKQYREGTVRVSRNKLSKAERSIARVLRMQGVQLTTQYHIPGVPYWYDFFFPDLGLIVEYQGNYWHANPKHYPPGTLLLIQGVGKVRVESIWERDLKKKEAATTAGYQVFYLWEDDYNLNGMSSLFELLQKQ